MGDELRHPFLCQCQHLYTALMEPVWLLLNAVARRYVQLPRIIPVFLPRADNTHWYRFSCRSTCSTRFRTSWTLDQNIASVTQTIVFQHVWFHTVQCPCSSGSGHIRYRILMSKIRCKAKSRKKVANDFQMFSPINAKTWLFPDSPISDGKSKPAAADYWDGGYSWGDCSAGIEKDWSVDDIWFNWAGCLVGLPEAGGGGSALPWDCLKCQTGLQPFQVGSI